MLARAFFVLSLVLILGGQRVAGGDDDDLDELEVQRVASMASKS